jgi:hypothetical protein
MSRMDAQNVRIATIVGEAEESTLDEVFDKFYHHLKTELQLPCDVTGVEDFRWEEYYVIGPGNPQEYERLCQTQPSYRDVFELLAIEKDVCSEWMMFHGEDVGAHVRRKSDGKEFWLGLAEIKAVDKKSRNHQQIDDYGCWFVNSR